MKAYSEIPTAHACTCQLTLCYFLDRLNGQNLSKNAGEIAILLLTTQNVEK